jgi:phosphoserine phosphatase RsbU/P
MKTHVAVFTQNQSLQTQLSERLHGTEFSIRTNPPLESETKEGIIVCDLDSYKSMNLVKEVAKKDCLFLVSNDSDEENMKVVVEDGLMHLVGWNEGVYAQELLCHFENLVHKRIWGLQSYLDESCELKILSLSDSKFTDEHIQDVLKHFDFKDYFASPTDYIRVMANELVSNSLYKGPNRRREEQGLDAADRKSPVYLKGSDLVQVTVGMDDKGVGLSVQDSFGGLSYDTLIASLKRSFAEKSIMDKKDGAGLGLYITFLHSNQFIVNHRENFRTEVICIIDKNKRYKNYKQRIRSFHYFEEVKGEKTNAK